MKLKDFFTKLKTDGKITDTEFVTFTETVPEVEIPDKAVQAFEASFLTIDRAATDKAVHSKLKREILDPVDANLKEILGFIDNIDHFKASEIDKMTSTYEKMKAINAAVPELYEKVKKTPVTDEETKKKLKTFEETNQELLQRIEKMNTEFSTKEKTIQGEYQKKISDFQLNIELEKMADSIKFGKAYSDPLIRKDITKAKLDKLRATAHLKLVDTDGQTAIQVTDREGKPLFKEGSNSAVTINQLLEDEFKPYIKANNTGDDDDEEGDDSGAQATKRFKVDDQKTKPRQGARTTVA